MGLEENIIENEELVDQMKLYIFIKKQLRLHYFSFNENYQGSREKTLAEYLNCSLVEVKSLN